MKTNYLIIPCLLLLFLSSCVQKSHPTTVVFTLHVSGIKDIKTVGIRGNDKPLSWDADTAMKEIKKDNVYQLTVSGKTAYRFTEVKFVVNGQFELQNQNNRRVNFSQTTDTTFYKATFNKL